MGHLEMVTRVLLQAPSPALSSNSSYVCDQEGGCVSDYVATGLTAFVALIVILGSVLLVVKRAVPEIKAKQTGLLLLQSIASLVWLASLLMTRNIFRISTRTKFWESCYLWQIWLEGPFGFGLLMSCHFARAFRLYYVFVGRRLPPMRSRYLVPLLLLPWIILAAVLQAVKPFSSMNECKAPWYIWFPIAFMHVFYSLLLILCTCLIRNIRFEFNEFVELVTGISICLLFLVVWAILYAVKTFGRGPTTPSDVIVRFLLVLLGDLLVMCLFWIPVARPLWAYIALSPILKRGRLNHWNDPSMGQALGVPHSGLLVPPASKIKLDEPLETLLKHKRFHRSFLEFAERRMASEVLHFWGEVRELSRLPHDNPDRRIYMVDHIIQKYIQIGSPCEINISHQMRADILNTSDLASPDLFKRASDEAINMMQTNLLEEYWQSKHFLDLKAEIDAEAEYGAQLERMDIRSFPARDSKPFSPFDYEGSVNPLDPVQSGGSLPYSGLPYSGPLDSRELELGMMEGTSGNSYVLGAGNTPPWEARLHEHTSPPLPRLQKVRSAKRGDKHRMRPPTHSLQEKNATRLTPSYPRHVSPPPYTASTTLGQDSSQTSDENDNPFYERRISR